VSIKLLEISPKYYGRKLYLSFTDAGNYLIEDAESGEKFTGKLGLMHKSTIGSYKILPSKAFKINAHEVYTLVFNNPEAVVSQYLGQLTVSLASKQSTVLNLNILTTLPNLGQDVLNTLIQVYNEASLVDKNKTTQSTIQFIDERLRLISGELTEVEKNVANFKSSRGLTNISSDADLFLESVKANDAQLSEINLKIGVIRDIQKFVNSSSSFEKLPSTLGIEDPVLLTQINQLGELQLQRDRLLATTTQDNPILGPITKQVVTTREGIRSSVNNILKSLQESKSALQANDSQFKGSIKKIPGQERQLISIKRQQGIKESLYIYLLQKTEEAALSYASTVADSRIVDSAYYSPTPVRPQRQIVYLVSLLFGVLFPIGYVYGKDLLNNKVEGVSDLQKLTDAPLLGEILFNDDSETIVVQEDSRRAIAEQFRSVRTNMQYLHGKDNLGKGRVTLFTSSMSGEGKSFVATNLAVALAISGKKTVLLELDLRKPKVSKYLQLTNSSGLSNYLIGKREMPEIISPSGIGPV